MQQFINKAYRFALTSIKYILLLLTGIFLLTSLLSTSYATDMGSQLVLFSWDNPLQTILGLLVMGSAFWGLAHLFTEKLSGKVSLLRFGVLGWYLLLNVILFLFSKTAPTADCYSVYNIAENLARGNTSVIHLTDSYISYYPHQVGLVAFWEGLIRLWNLVPIDLHAYHFIKVINALLGCIIILVQEKTVHLLWQDKKADCLYLILAGANCPLLLYASYVYSEIPSFAALSVSLYFLLKLLLCSGDRENIGSQKNSLRIFFHAFVALFFLTWSVMLRKNSLIFMIAIVIVVLLWGLKQKRYSLLPFAALCVICSLVVLPITQTYYEQRSGNTINTGVTATSYFAMGMQEGPRANGWYNGFNFNTYRDTGMDTELTNQISLDSIRERLDYFKQNPGYAANFYLKKYLSQWADGSYACRQSTVSTAGGRRDFFVEVYEGKYSGYVIAYCNIYQNFMYLGTFAFCFGALRKKREKTSEDTAIGYSLPAYMGLIGVLGGFLFHMIWEANSRYILLYGFTMLPFAAKGLSSLTSSISSWLSVKISLKAR